MISSIYELDLTLTDILTTKRENEIFGLFVIFIDYTNQICLSHNPISRAAF